MATPTSPLTASYLDEFLPDISPATRVDLVALMDACPPTWHGWSCGTCTAAAAALQAAAVQPPAVQPVG